MAGVTAGNSLAWYVAELVRRLGAGDRVALERLRTIVGSQRARITLEEATVDVCFDGRLGLIVADVKAGEHPLGSLDGEGHIRHHVVLELLDGERDVTDAILAGDIDVRGSDAAVAAMFAAIEILIDSATRIPQLRELASDYVAAHAGHRRDAAMRRRSTAHSRAADPLEVALLEQLGLRHDA